MQALRFTGTDRYTVAADTSHESILHNTYLVWTVSGDPSDGSKYFLRKTQGGSTLRRQFLHSGANISGAITGTGTWNIGAARDQFAAHTPARGVPNFIAAVLTGTGVATDQKLYLGTHRIPASEPAAYLFRNGGTAVASDASATTVLGNRHLFDSPVGPWALWAWFKRVLRVDEIHAFQFNPFSSRWTDDPDCIMFHVWDVPSFTVRDRSTYGNDALAAFASISMARALVPMPTRFFVRDRGLAALPVVGTTPVSASFAVGYESVAGASVTAAPAWESGAGVAEVAGPAWEALSGAVSATAHGWEALAGVARAAVEGWESGAGAEGSGLIGWEALAPAAALGPFGWESLAGVEEEAEVEWEADGAPVTPVEASHTVGWEALGSARESLTVDWESLYTWPWGEVTIKRVAIFALASDQVPGQTVVSRIGPNGWLGNSPSDAVGDPTLDLTPPERWVMGGVAGVGLDWGDVLGSTLDHPEGFTVVVVPDVVTPSGKQIALWQKYRFSPLKQGPTFNLVGTANGMFVLIVLAYEGTGVNTDFVSSDSALMQNGRHVIGFHLDQTLPRATRYQVWQDGAAVPTVNGFQQGPGTGYIPVDSSGVHLRVGGPQGANIPPASVRAFVMVEGILDASTHANMAQWFRDNGWLAPAVRSVVAAWESTRYLAGTFASQWEALGAIAAEVAVAWEAEGTVLAALYELRIAATRIVPLVRVNDRAIRPIVRAEQTSIRPIVSGDIE